jgi:hypothetical protein
MLDVIAGITCFMTDVYSSALMISTGEVSVVPFAGKIWPNVCQMIL